ncbi:antitoxin HipB [Shigella sonnei]|nr:type II toxin-antitoxin system antitoxin HipB [Shigella sonnei]CSN73653.1 antitoxin HipB [Shigella sonnei]
MPIIAPISRDERRLMQKAIHKTHDKNYARRLTAMLMLHRGDRVSDVARTLCCARSSVGRWINWFTQSGVEGLKLANAMKLVRQQNGWTQSELAKKIGIKQATISNFENNPDNTTLTTFFKILQSLELSMTLCDAKNASPEATEQQDLEW